MREDYELICRLGQGAYGVVLKAKHRESGAMVAVKQITLKTELKSQLDTFREISCLKNCDHENIVSLRDVHFTSTLAVIVLEFVESNLKMVVQDVHRPKNIHLAKFYFVQLLYGLAYLHHLGIMHRPENLLITSANKLKIADFGLACLYFADDPKRNYEHQVMTRHYRAPEILLGSVKYDPKIDLWAVGCILAEYLNGATLFPGTNDIDQLVRVFRVLGTPTSESWPGWERLPDSLKVVFDSKPPVSDWLTIVPTATPECLTILTALLRLNPKERPTALECLQKEFFIRRVPKSFDDYTPPSIEQVHEQRKQKRDARGRKNRRRGEWDVVYNDEMDVTPYLM